MKMFYSSHSPFARKVLVAAHELGLFDSVDLLPSAAGPVVRDASIVKINPLGQVPTVITDDGTLLADSRVICEYLNHKASGTLFPTDGDARWVALTDASVADGLLNAALLARYEHVLRPENLQWADWVSGQMAKISSTLDYFAPRSASLHGRVDIGTITLGCGLSYLDHRFPDFDWRDGRADLGQWYAQVAERASFQATRLGVDRLAP